MKSILAIALSALLAGSAALAQQPYVPSPEIKQAQQQFSDYGFGIFLHWGIYSMFGQGEWYLQTGDLNAEEYAKAARGFYPADFDAAKWVKAIKDAGAKYITITSRHHDGFSMWHTQQSPYNIVDATPFKRDILKELADECHKQGIALHLYYSQLDWTRPDYVWGNTGHMTGRDPELQNWDSYYAFMNAQLTELLTQYGPIGAIWYDGMWDHDADFDWGLEKQYALIHSLQPSCLIGSNHHRTPYPGEDIQIFERDLPGNNNAGLSGQEVSKLPLETCETMNGVWGYKIQDQNYKSVDELVLYLTGAASKGANLLLNIGPQPNGELPATALERLQGMGKWLNVYGETIYGTEAGDFKEQEWGMATRKGEKLYVHITAADASDIELPITKKVKKAYGFIDGEKVKFTQKKGSAPTLHLGEYSLDPTYVIVVETD